MAAGLDIAALYKAGLYGADGAQLGLRYAIPVRAQAGLPAKPRLLELRSISMQSVFPVLRSYYDQNPVGSAKIVNTSKETANNVRVSFIVKQYMGAPEKQTRIYRRKR
jgi:hypothetical protein